MTDSYFSSGNLPTRFLCYFGNAGDLFVDETLYPQNIEHSLHRRLRQNGFERIVFYSYAKGAYFLDGESKELWHGRKEKKQPSSLFGGKSLLKGKLLSQPAAAAGKKKEPLSYTVDAAEMLRTVEYFIKDSSIKTAVIFPYGEVIREFAALDQGKLLDNFFVRITESSVDQVLNSNVVIFVFNRSTQQVRELLSGRERESLSKYLLDPAISTSHQIPLPGKTEVRRMLNYLRLYGDGKHTLKLDCAQLPQISEMIAKKLAVNNADKVSRQQHMPDRLQAYDLQGTMAYLMKRFVLPEKTLDLDACRGICAREDVRAIDQLNELIGMENVKEAVRGFLNLHKIMEKREVPDCGCRLDRARLLPEKKRINLHFALVGRQGTGKTTVAQLLGEILCEYGFLSTGHTVIRRVTELLQGGHVGDAERNIISAVQEALGGVLFIDEAYDLIKPEASGIVTQLLANMETYKGQLSVVFAGYEDRMQELMDRGNPGLKSRIGENWVHIEDYTPSELVEIFRLKARKEKLAVSPELEALLPVLIRNWYFDKRYTDWANGRQMENLLGAMRKKCAHGVLEVSMIPENLLPYTTAKAEEDAIEALNSMIGLQSVKDEIMNLQLSSEFENEVMPKHFIFAGPPGAGKTTVAELLGKILKNMGILRNGHVVTTRPPELIAEFVGGSAEKARKVFDTALDGVLFIDEAYGLVPSQRFGGKEKDFGGAVLDLMLKYTDPGNAMPMCFICAGYEEEMQEFLAYNPGLSSRFYMIHFEGYTVDELMQILELKLKKLGYQAQPGYLEAARHNFAANHDDIARKANGRYVSGYIDSSKTRLFKRLKETYGKSANVPQEERHLLREVDAP